MQNEPLKNKVAIVTGASKGIGKAIALSLAKAGMSVALAARDRKGLEAVAKEIESGGGASAVIPTDVSVESQVANLIKETSKKYGRVDVLVNNAGYGVFSNIIDADVKDFDGMMQVNLRGVFLCCKAVLPYMFRQNGGDIINISSLAGKNSFVGGAMYSATKWGLIGFSRSLMLEVREHNVRVVTICPGSVNTSFSDHSGDAGKIIQPEDVAETVFFALSMPGRSNVSEIDIRPTLKPK